MLHTLRRGRKNGGQNMRGPSCGPFPASLLHSTPPPTSHSGHSKLLTILTNMCHLSLCCISTKLFSLPEIIFPCHHLNQHHHHFLPRPLFICHASGAPPSSASQGRLTGPPPYPSLLWDPKQCLPSRTALWFVYVMGMQTHDLTKISNTVLKSI